MDYKRQKFSAWSWRPESVEAKRAIPHLTFLGFGRFSKCKVHLPMKEPGYKLAFPLRNEILYQSAGDLYGVCPGQAIFFGPWQEQRTPDDTIGPCDMAWINIQPRSSSPKGSLSFSPLLPLPKTVVSAMGRCFGAHPLAILPVAESLLGTVYRIRTELTQQHFGFESIVNILLGELLITLHRQLTAVQDEMTMMPAGVLAVIQSMRQEPAREWSADTLVQRVGLGKTQLTHWFKIATGCTPHGYLMRLRLAEAKSMLADGQKTITDVAHALGFSSSSHFSGLFSNTFGISPTTFRKASRQNVTVGELRSIEFIMREIRNDPATPWQERPWVVRRHQDQRRFKSIFKKISGLSPDEYQAACQIAS